MSGDAQVGDTAGRGEGGTAGELARELGQGNGERRMESGVGGAAVNEEARDESERRALARRGPDDAARADLESGAPVDFEAAGSGRTAGQGVLPPPLPGARPPRIGERGTAGAAGVPSRVARWFLGFVKYMIGVLGTQGLTGGILVIGWSYRLAQRAAWRVWWTRGGAEQGTFTEFLGARAETRGSVSWPNWFVNQEARELWRGRATVSGVARVKLFFRVLFGSLAANFRLGMQGVLNTWLLTLPGCLLMLFAWYDGWNNSFNKGYEQFDVGPTLGLTGIALFIAAMLYVPLAQARQAVTGDWRTFYDFGLVARLALRSWLGCLFLAGVYAAVSVPVGILKTVPTFFPQMDPAQAAEVAALSPELAKAKVTEILSGYFWWAGWFVFPAFVILRVLAARLYAWGILRGLRDGWVSPAELAGNERAVLERLQLVQPGARASWPKLVELIARTGSWGARLGALGALGFVWFLFVAQIFVTEFLGYHPQVGWLNQPLVQVPWFRYLPESAQQPVEEVGFLVLVLALIFAARVVRRVGRFLRGGAAAGEVQGST